MPADSAPFRHAYADRTALARAWKAAGGKIVGYVCDNVPTALIRAAGFLPFRLYGDADSSRDAIAAQIVPFHARRFAGNEFIEAIFARIVAGEANFCDYLVIPHNRKIVGSLMQSVENLRPSRPAGALPEIHYLDRTYTRNFRASMFNQASLRQLRARLEAWSGKPIAADALLAEIGRGNETRSLLRETNALRQGGVPRLSGVEALQVFGAAHYMAPETYNPALRAFNAAVAGRDPLPGLPVYCGGSPWDHPGLYEAVESCGAVIVGEDHCWGARCGDFAPDGGDPFAALADRFALQPACSLQGSIDATVAAVVARAVASGAQHAIFAVIEGDLSQTWETPSTIAALEERGIRCLHLRHLPYHADFRPDVLARLASFTQPVTGGAA